MFKFASPYFLLLIPIIIYLFLRKRSNLGITVPGIEPLRAYKIKSKKYLLGKYLILLSLILMSVALARPQMIYENRVVKKNGIDIAISLDLSQSMLQDDFSPNRLEKAKEVLGEFIDKRGNDRLSLIVFGGDAYTKVPLTFDHNVVKEMVSKLTVDDITSNNRTAIGMGIGVALNRLKNSEAKSKVIILLTDGENNSGEMSPSAAADIAKELGIKIYTIGIGARELQVPTLFGYRTVKNNELDENLLQNIAKTTGGEYFRAGDSKEFKEIFNKIDELEKTKIDGRSFYDKQEMFEGILKIALIFLLLGVFFQYLIYIIIP
ncbi:VWA domain-containing protein [uncultured Fusobacterium sp.]|uniref:vWA domain-containing protein n=1 Tax=uncultured Fusobacterium sp. TaxID=159267 RepID=UPI0025F843E5|nr:VWA domain-containing protein [uncultured Fusobacterium sp.]MCF2638551.1 VWA domain-containing protein [Fusobacterium varium]